MPRRGCVASAFDWGSRGRSPLAGVLGAAITLLLVGAIGFGLKKYASHHG